MSRALQNVGASGSIPAAAREFARMGVLVFVCAPNGKHPITPQGFHDATTDLNQIEEWWRTPGWANVLRQEMRTMTSALRAADLSFTEWLSTGQIAVILRSAYDPAIASTLDRHGDLGQELATAGLVAVNEAWGHLRTDSAYHAVLWVSEWPRSLVHPGFLAPVLLSTGVLRSFSLIVTPMRTDQAARDIRKKKVEYVSDDAQRARIGQIEDASQNAEYQEQQTDLTAGHGVLRYSGPVSVTADTLEDLDAAVSAITKAAIQSSCETRKLVGQQAKAFTAALPLCRQV
ncbi:hypothetical protein FHX35_002422 [Auritidibacter ignavus]|nr:hypothetical protein [Auritidibacter ignavus]